jgi:uncharacterized iron-regulated membrane protein
MTPKATRPETTRRLLAIHRIAGLVVSINLLLVTLTGIVLIYHHEIDDALGNSPRSSGGEGTLPLAELIGRARAAKPSANPISLFQDQEDHPGIVYIGMAEGHRRFEGSTFLVLDQHDGRIVDAPEFDETFVGVVYLLHARLLAGPLGSYLVGLVGIAYLLTLVTGFLVYGPMMRRFSFGMLRTDKHRRTLFADIHKWLGAATFGWNFVVAFTGIVLTLGVPMLQLYSATELAEVGRPFAEEPVVTDLSTIDAAVDSALRAAPGKDWSFISLPGSELASTRHFSLFLEGGEGIESRMRSLALVDARMPSSVDYRELPWYLRALMLSEPLHFGDYGGWALKLVWAVFSIITVVISVTGVYVHLASRKQKAARGRTSPLDLSAEVNA